MVTAGSAAAAPLPLSRLMPRLILDCILYDDADVAMQEDAAHTRPTLRAMPAATDSQPPFTRRHASYADAAASALLPAPRDDAEGR